MGEGFQLSIILPATPEEIYSAWLSSEGHSAMTDSPAHVDGTIGGDFSAWDGYISGRTLDLDPLRRLVQAWRTTGFPADAQDSRVEILLEPVLDGTRLTLLHTGMPAGQEEDYRQGWQDFYFIPMEKYFGAW